MSMAVKIWIVGAPAALFMNWADEDAIRRLFKEAEGTLRKGDPEYAQARLIAAACAVMGKGAFGVGVVPAPTQLQVDAGFVEKNLPVKNRRTADDGRIPQYTTGQCGVGVIDEVTGKVEWFAGKFADSVHVPRHVVMGHEAGRVDAPGIGAGIPAHEVAQTGAAIVGQVLAEAAGAVAGRGAGGDGGVRVVDGAGAKDNVKPIADRTDRETGEEGSCKSEWPG